MDYILEVTLEEFIRQLDRALEGLTTLNEGESILIKGEENGYH